MKAGPFDSRRRRSRCLSCSVSHLKCDGRAPCSNCGRRSIECSYRVTFSTSTIQVGSGSSTIFSSTTTTTTPTLGLVLEGDQYLSSFDVFALRNSFLGKKYGIADAIKTLSCLHASPYLLDTVRSVGASLAAQLASQGGICRSKHRCQGLMLYSRAVTGLRHGLDVADGRLLESSRIALLWTTLLLGFFELMNEEADARWLRHMVLGTTKGLQAAGPSICRSEAGIRLFLHAKTFEVCRCMLYNDATFLATEEWRAESRRMRQGAAFTLKLGRLDTLLDIMLKCSALLMQLVKLSKSVGIYESAGQRGTHVPPVVQTLVMAGCTLRSELDAWYEKHFGTASIRTTALVNEDGPTVLSRLFFSATKLFLSGMFEQARPFWTNLGLVVPLVQDADARVRAIIALMETALASTDVSPLLLLLPLRIAGTYMVGEQRIQLVAFLDEINRHFAVSQAVKSGLQEYWTQQAWLAS